MFKILLKKATWIAFLQKNKEIAKECCEEISEFILSVPEKYMVHIRNACIILICYVIASFFTYPEFKIDVFFKEIFSLLCTYGAVFLYFGDKIDNEVPFRISVAVTAFVAPVLFINNPFGVAFLSLALIVFCEFLVFEYYRGCRLFSDLIPVYVICENEADAERASEFFDDYKVLELVVLSGKNCYGSLNSAEDTEKWLKKITRMPFYPSPRRLLYFSETPNEDTFFKLMKLAANFAIPLFKAVKNASSSNTLSIAPVSLGDIESNEVALDKATLNASFKGKRVWICYDGRGSVLDLICAISFVNSVDITVYCESERLMFEADQELSERCPNKNYKIKIVDMQLFELQSGKPDILFYNMPVKSIRSGEENLKEAVIKNVLETRCLINFAHSNKIPLVFILSGSGALNARNWIGATQRLGELFAQFADSQSKKTFTKFRVIRIPASISDPSIVFGKIISSIFVNGCVNCSCENSEKGAVYYRKDILPLLIKAVTFLMKSNDITSGVYTIVPKNSLTFDSFVESMCETVCLKPHRDVQILKNNNPKEMELDDFIDINEPLEKTAVAGILRTKFFCTNADNYNNIWTKEEISAMTTRELISAVFQNLNEKIKIL